MPRTWFRHEATMRHDPAVAQLAKEFGPIGEVIWSRLLEVHCQTDGDIIASLDSLRANLALRPEWEVDLDAWLRRAAQLRLVKLGKRRNDLRTIAVRAWTKYQPRTDTPQYEREKKARQRGQFSRGTGPGQDRDVPAVSRPTDVRTRRNPTKQDETTQNEGLTGRETNEVESVSDEGRPTTNGRVQAPNTESRSERESTALSREEAMAAIRTKTAPRRATG